MNNSPITAREKFALNAYLNRTQKEYMEFMGLDSFPAVERKPVVLTMEEANAKGYGVWAQVLYNVETDKYSLLAWKDLYIPELHADYILFHEYTHVADIEKLAKKDKSKYTKIRGYMEYHASQVELMKQLGATHFSDKISFSMNDVVYGVANDRPVIDVLRNGKKTATDLIQRVDFPTNVEMLATTISLIFNHLGRISICKLYATDYFLYQNELEEFGVEEVFFGKDAWLLIRAIMQGIMSESAIEMEAGIHVGILCRLFERYGL
ncbi:MAG: hypothetical protein IJJ01_09855 [Firmicutes bacterium]|nr:hypothetical protein [Bacillota bacterium]